MNRRLMLLSSIALLLGAVLLVDWAGPPPPSQTEAPDVMDKPPATSSEAGAAQVQATLNPLQSLDAGSFTAMLERPLFNPGRAPRPAEPPPEPPPPVEQAPPEMLPEEPGPRVEDFALVAIAAGPSGRVAAVRLATTGEVLYLREGQSVQAWSVLAVGNRTVVIGTSESSVELSLFDSDAPRAAEAVKEAMPPGDEESSFDVQPEPSIESGQMN